MAKRAKSSTTTTATARIAEQNTDAAASAPGFQQKPIVEPEAPSKSVWSRIDRPFMLGFLLTLGGLTAFVAGVAIANLSTVLMYIAIALFASLGLDPAVRFLERRKVKRGPATAIVILGLLGIIGVVVAAIVPIVVRQVASFVNDVPTIIADFQVSELYLQLEERFGEQFEDGLAEIEKFFSNIDNIALIGGGALQVGASIASGVSGVIVVLVLTLYFVATLPAMKSTLLRFAPARDRENVSLITNQITESVGSYVLGMVTLAFANALFVLVMYLVLDLPSPALLATVAFAVTLIPLVGSVIFWAIGSLIALFVDPILALIFAGSYLVYMQVESYVLTPRIMNRAVAVPGALVVIGALAGGTLLGLLGALVAVPVTASILIIIKQVWLPRQDARV